MRFNATLQAAYELSSVTVKEIATTNSSLTEATSEQQKLSKTVTDLRAQLTLQALQPVDCVLTEWSEWGECNAKCDSGKRHRSRGVSSRGSPVRILSWLMASGVQNSNKRWTVFFRASTGRAMLRGAVRCVWRWETEHAG